MPHHAIELEITETGLMKDLQNVIPSLHRLNEIGVEISIDDFGTGYSSLAYLTTLPISELKIDRSFVRDLGMTPQSSAVVTAIIALARSLGLRVIAEGVENLRQMEVLHRLGCGVMQGFLFSKPQPPEDIEDWLRADRAAAQGALDRQGRQRRRHEPTPPRVTRARPAHQAASPERIGVAVEVTRPSPGAPCRPPRSSTAAQLAKAGVCAGSRVERLEPTPENYERAYRQECRRPPSAKRPATALATLIERIVARPGARRPQLDRGATQGRHPARARRQPQRLASGCSSGSRS